MPELPEIVVISEQMDSALKGKTVASVLIFQPKMLNRPISDFDKILPQKTIVSAQPFGKWIVLQCTENYRVLINLGMGGEILYFTNKQDPPPNSRAVVKFSDGTGFFITLWWFGYFHLVGPNESHPMTDTLGPDPMTLSEPEFCRLLENRKGQIKPFLLNQKNIRGIGNYYIQEILYRAKLHPLRPIPTLTQNEKQKLYHAIQSVLREAIALGGSDYEKNFWGKSGGFGLSRMPIAYRENAICPNCKTKIKKIPTGSTSQFICPQCQPLNPRRKN